MPVFYNQIAKEQELLDRDRAEMKTRQKHIHIRDRKTRSPLHQNTDDRPPLRMPTGMGAGGMGAGGVNPALVCSLLDIFRFNLRSNGGLHVNFTITSQVCGIFSL